MALIELTPEELDKQFEAFHAKKSPLRAIAQAKRPNDDEEFKGDASVDRFKEHSLEYVKMFSEAVDTLIESSQEASKLKG